MGFHAKPSIMEGIARLYDPLGALNEYNFISDQDAIYKDWWTVGRDMQRSISVFTEDRSWIKT